MCQKINKGRNERESFYFGMPWFGWIKQEKMDETKKKYAPNIK